MIENEEFYLLYITCKDKVQARSIGTALVKRKNVACVNIIDKMESIYIWDNELIEDSEVILIAKSIKSKFKEIEITIKELHSYSNPCIISLKIIDGSLDYLDWIKNSINI
jgi:periplasmic divalent cation tolerance protein